MKKYERAISFRLIWRRIILLILFALAILLFQKNQTDYAIVLSGLILTLCIFHVTALKIEENTMEITRYYAFGTIPVKTSFDKLNHVSIAPVEISLDPDNNQILDYDNSNAGWLMALLPAPKMKYQTFKITQISDNGKTKRIKEKLTHEEYNLIKDFLKLTTIQHAGYYAKKNT